MALVLRFLAQEPPSGRGGQTWQWLDKQMVLPQEVDIRLTPIEFTALKLLAKNQGNDWIVTLKKTHHYLLEEPGTILKNQQCHPLFAATAYSQLSTSILYPLRRVINEF